MALEQPLLLDLPREEGWAWTAKERRWFQVLAEACQILADSQNGPNVTRLVAWFVAFVSQLTQSLTTG